MLTLMDCVIKQGPGFCKLMLHPSVVEWTVMEQRKQACILTGLVLLIN